MAFKLHSAGAAVLLPGWGCWLQNGAAPHRPHHRSPALPPGFNSPVQKDTLLAWNGLGALFSLLKSISNACSGWQEVFQQADFKH